MRTIIIRQLGPLLIAISIAGCFPTSSPDAEGGGGRRTRCDMLPAATESPRPVDPCTDGAVVVGPERFVRSAGAPSDALRSFEMVTSGEVCVRVDNGTGPARSRVAAGFIGIDGEALIGPNAFHPHVERIERRAMLGPGSHELSVRLASAPASELSVEIRFVPARALSRQDAMIARLFESLDTRVEAVLASLPEDDRADLLNGLAWLGQSPVDLELTRGHRGGLTHVSSRFLAHEVDPALAPAPTVERAEGFVQACDGGRALLALRDDDELSLDRAIDHPDGTRRFVFRQSWRGIPVYGAEVQVDLDAGGGLLRLDATTVPGVAPPPARRISRREAEGIALHSVRALDAPLWGGVEPAVQSSDEQVVHRLPWTGDDDERIAWRVAVVPAGGRIGGRREVLVDRSDGTVIASVELARLLGAADQILQASGTIGNGLPTLGGTLWDGTQRCPGREDAPVGRTPFDRDLDEVQAALCEAELFFAERGAEAGQPDPRAWLDAAGDGIRVGIGAGARLSIGVNDGTDILLAEGAGRAEVVGHELVHSVLGPDTTIITFTHGGGGGSLTQAEGEAIEEHMGDALGLMLEQRFAFRNEDRCLLSDDEDTKIAIAMADNPDRPCSLLDLEREWRSMCEPRNDNGGWCEGSARYTDLGYNRYDTYGETSRSNDHVASHTSLGVGNRPLAALMGLLGTPEGRVDGWRVPALPRADVERLWFRTALELPVATDWTRWAQAWWRETAYFYDPTRFTREEQAVRTAHVSSALWNVPHTASAVPPVVGGGLPGFPLPLGPVTPTTRPAVTQLRLAGGTLRTFVFYREMVDSTRLRYVWVDEIPGGPFAQVPATFVGPCDLPFAADTRESPAAASSDGAAFVLWSEPTATDAIGRLRGAVLSTADAGATGCNDAWAPIAPGTERLVRGGPAAAVWTLGELAIDCDVLTELGILPPFRAVGPMGLSVEGCVEIVEREPQPIGPFSPSLGQEMLDRLMELAAAEEARRAPVPYDPLRPFPDFQGVIERATFDLVPLLTEDPDARNDFEKIGGGIGLRFAEAFASAGAPSGLSADAFLDVKIADPLGPTGTIEAIHFRFRPQILVVAFRDTAGALRIVPFASDAPTSAIPTLDPSPNATDPALAIATVPGRIGEVFVDRELLYAVYGTSDLVDGTPVPTRLSYRVATALGPDGAFDEAIFAPPRRIDTIEDTRGVRRKIDYATARTLRAPVVAGGHNALHLFTVSLAIPDFQASDRLGAPPPVGDGERDERSGATNRIRYTQLRVLASGELTWTSERPVMLLDTSLDFSPPPLGTRAQAGAAIVGSDRNQLRFWYPRGSDLSVRSRVLR